MTTAGCASGGCRAAATFANCGAGGGAPPPPPPAEQGAGSGAVQASPLITSAPQLCDQVGAPAGHCECAQLNANFRDKGLTYAWNQEAKTARSEEFREEHAADQDFQRCQKFVRHQFKMPV